MPRLSLHGRPPLALLLASLLLGATVLVLAPAEAEAQSTPAPTVASRVLAINQASAKPAVPFKGFDSNPPKVYDFDGDGQLEIIAQNDNHWVYVFDSRTGRILTEVTTLIPTNWGARSFNGPEAAVLESGEQPRLIVANSAAVITSFVYDPIASTRTQLLLVKEWERRLDTCYAHPGMDAKPVFADLDKDGALDILAATEDKGIYALRADGSILWASCIIGGNAEPGLGDLDQDGWLDVVHVSDLAVVTALDGRTGTQKWRYNALHDFRLGSGSMPIAPAIGQIDGKGGPDILVGARDSHNATDWSKDHALLLALNSTGKLIWGVQDQMAAPLTYTHPIIADADLDGTDEIYWADWNTVGHYPPHDPKDRWKRTGPAHIYRFTLAGSLEWRQTLDTWWHNKDIPIADLDGDGVQEVIANGPSPSGAHDGLWTLDVRTGAKESFIDLYPWKLARAPIVADLYGNGTMQLVMEVGQHAPAAGGAGLLVYDTGRPYASVWPHVPYAEDMPRGNAPPPAAGSGGNATQVRQFASNFTVKAPNQWWAELYPKVPTGHAVVNASYRIDGGDWKPLGKSSWGAWTSSKNRMAPNATVEFEVKDQTGALSRSAPFRWLDGNLTKPSVPIPPQPMVPPPPPPPPPFDARFTVSSNVNRWWVEAKVAGNEDIVGVAAIVDGKGPVTLAKTDWGHWAKSFHVPANSTVVFQATGASGRSDVSDPTRWP